MAVPKKNSRSSTILGLGDISEVYKTGIYKLYHVDNASLIYVGSASKVNSSAYNKDSAIGFASRYSYHITALKKRIHHSKKLISLMDMYGLDGIVMEVLEVCDPELCIEREQYWLELLKPELNTFRNATAKGHVHLEGSRNMGRKPKK